MEKDEHILKQNCSSKILQYINERKISRRQKSFKKNETKHLIITLNSCTENKTIRVDNPIQYTDTYQHHTVKENQNITLKQKNNKIEKQTNQSSIVHKEIQINQKNINKEISTDSKLKKLTPTDYIRMNKQKITSI